MPHTMPKLLIVTLGLSLAGCATDSRLSAGVPDPCESLTSIVENHDAGFEQLRGARSDFNSFTLYRAKEELVRGHCEIWSWAGGDYAYVCTANSPTPEVAAQRYDTSIRYVKQCLGDNWKVETVQRERDGKNLGEATRFTSQDYPDLVVSVQNLSPEKSYRQWYSNYLYIGSPARSPALIQ